MGNFHLHFINFINTILNLIADWNYTILLFVGLLFGLFVWGLVATYRLSNQTSKSFKRASDVITKHVDDKHHRGFYEKFNQIEKEIQQIPMMKHVWHEFCESTFPDEDNRQICLSTRPNTYFHKNAALSIKGNVKQVQAFPNYLIGLGLFFTFLGLAAALSIAQAGLGDAEQSQQALQDLLKTASIKFISSLFAILLSLALSFYQRKAFNACAKAVNDFCSLIEERTEYLPAEKLLMKSMKIEREQLKAQQDMALNISEKLGEMLAKSLPDSIIQALNPLVTEIRGMAANFQGSNETALQQVLQEFLEQLRGSTGKDMDALVSTVQTLKTGLEVLTANIQGMGANFGEDTRQSSALLTDTLQNFVQTFQPVQEGMADFGKTLGALERISAQIDKAGGNIHGAAATNAESVANLAQTVTGVSDHILPLKEAMMHLQASLQMVADTSQMMQQAGTMIGAAATDFHHSANQMGNSLQHFTQTADGISNTVITLREASSQVSNAVNPLAKASDGITQVASSILQTEKRLQEGQAVLHQMLEQIRFIEGNIPHILKEYEERFGKVDEDLSKAFEKLSEGSDQFQHAMVDVVLKLDNSFNNALNALGSKIDELAETQEIQYSNAG
jgi:ABC-type transporter Mla subunit MlaD/ABC-type phosphate/phosphonate transport system permease subunit